jgi:hypothetical protein
MVTIAMATTIATPIKGKETPELLIVEVGVGVGVIIICSELESTNK